MSRISALAWRALSQTHHLPVRLRKTGRRSAVLGALLLAASTATVLATANTPPTITSAVASASVLNEGQTVTLSVTFTDPDVADLHTVRVRWFDNANYRTQVLQLPAGQTSFQVNHRYTDGPLWAPKIAIAVYDRQDPPGSNDNADGSGKAYREVPIQVNNVAPRFVDSSVTVTKTGGSQVNVEGDFTDPGSADEMQVTATWGEPSLPGATTCSLSERSRHFLCEHTYRPSLQSKSYSIGLTVKDDDGGIDQHKTTVRLP